jgi:hypothetical protein
LQIEARDTDEDSIISKESVMGSPRVETDFPSGLSSFNVQMVGPNGITTDATFEIADMAPSSIEWQPRNHAFHVLAGTSSLQTHLYAYSRWDYGGHYDGFGSSLRVSTADGKNVQLFITEEAEQICNALSRQMDGVADFERAQV